MIITLIQVDIVIGQPILTPDNHKRITLKKKKPPQEKLKEEKSEKNYKNY